MADYYSAQERAAIVRKFESSGVSVADFSQWARLPRWRLRSWLEAARAPEAATWMEVVVEGDDKQADEPGGARC